jgi:hypothetical protein
MDAADEKQKLGGIGVVGVCRPPEGK